MWRNGWSRHRPPHRLLRLPLGNVEVAVGLEAVKFQVRLLRPVGLTKEQASFIAKFLAPQARPPSGGMHSRHGERLYSQIVAAVKTVDVRTKFLETMMREMSRLLERVPFEVGQFLHDGSL